MCSELKTSPFDGCLVGANSMCVVSDVVAKHLRMSVEVVVYLKGECSVKPRAHFDDTDAPVRSK